MLPKQADRILNEVRWVLYPVMKRWPAREKTFLGHDVAVAKILSANRPRRSLRRLLDLHEVGSVLATAIMHCHQDRWVPMDRWTRDYVESLRLVRGFKAASFDLRNRSSRRMYLSVCKAVGQYVAESRHLRTVRDFVREAAT